MISLMRKRATLQKSSASALEMFLRTSKVVSEMV